MIETEVISLDKRKGKSLPLYRQVEVRIKDLIQKGTLTHGQRLPAVSKLVEQLKVDYVTINSAFKSLEKEGYIKCEPGRGKGPLVVKNSRVRHHFLFVRWDLMRQSISITEGIRRFADENEQDYTIIYAQQNHDIAVECIANPPKGVDGLIVMPHDVLPTYRTAVLKALDKGIKVVFVDRFLDGIPVSSVSMDHVGAAYQMTNHMLAHGHPVHYFGFVEFPSSCRDRLKGWNLAMAEHGFVNQEQYICDLSKEYSDNDQEQANRIQSAAHRFFVSHKSCKKFSLLCHADSVARGVCLAAKELGYEIGKDVFVAGFGNLPICERLPVKLSSVGQPDEEVGYEAAKILHEEITQPNLQHRIHLLPAQICIRESSAGVKES